MHKAPREYRTQDTHVGFVFLDLLQDECKTSHCMKNGSTYLAARCDWQLVLRKKKAWCKLEAGWSESSRTSLTRVMRELSAVSTCAMACETAVTSGGFPVSGLIGLASSSLLFSPACGVGRHRQLERAAALRRRPLHRQLEGATGLRRWSYQLERATGLRCSSYKLKRATGLRCRP